MSQKVHFRNAALVVLVAFCAGLLVIWRLRVAGSRAIPNDIPPGALAATRTLGPDETIGQAPAAVPTGAPAAPVTPPS